MPYLDYTDAWLRDLTRQRRLERELTRPEAPIVRFSVQGDEFTPSISCSAATSRSKPRAKAWRQEQWRTGNRRCTYCEVDLVNVPKKSRAGVPVDARMVTVDHRHPVGLGGDDAAWNFVIACFRCNNRKGFMTEAEFRTLRANEQLVAAE